MSKKWGLLTLVLFSSLSALTIQDALNELKQNPYGFCFVDIGVTSSDLADFNSIDIQGDRFLQGEHFYQQFGDLDQVENGTIHFLHEIGDNSEDLVKRVASRITAITNEVMKASGRETAWFHLRASSPITAFDIPRWHIDGSYFSRPKNSSYMMYKFATTLMGAPTLFYYIPKELRREAWSHMLDRKYMQKFCQKELTISPQQGEGSFLLAGRMTDSALHSEPPIHENRLFLSITPCNQKELQELKKKIMSIYPKTRKNQ